MPSMARFPILLNWKNVASNLTYQRLILASDLNTIHQICFSTMLRMTNTFVLKNISCRYGHSARVKRILFIERTQKCVMPARWRMNALAAKVGGIYFVHFIKKILTELNLIMRPRHSKSRCEKAVCGLSRYLVKPKTFTAWGGSIWEVCTKWTSKEWWSQRGKT